MRLLNETRARILIIIAVQDYTLFSLGILRLVNRVVHDDDSISCRMSGDDMMQKYLFELS